MLHFIKMHGIGNDYIYIDGSKESLPNDLNSLAIRLSDRHTGIGGDGIVIILPSDVATCRMRIFNSDGSEGKMCGNAIRCVGKYIYESGLTLDKHVTIETLSGIKHLNMTVNNGVVSDIEVDMGMASVEPKTIPMIASEPMVATQIEVGGDQYTVTAVSIGNPHLVINSKDVDKLNLEKIGPAFENHTLFPERVNTEFVEQIDRTTLRMRVWERGSGETMACGTGACAAVVAFALQGMVERNAPITVKLSGGDLRIIYLDNGRVFMNGPATEVFRGEIEI